MATTRTVMQRRPSGEHGLKADAIGFISVLVIGLASTAPAYSLAAVIGLVAVLVGVQAPAALLASFIPMFFIAAAFYYMNRADQDCGTTFSWVTRAMGPSVGWMAGWAVCVTSVLVIGSLADVAARYTYLLFELDVLATSKVAVTTLAVIYIAVLTTISVIGIEPSARLQGVLIVAQVLALLLFASVALTKVFSGSAAEGSLQPQIDWFSPLAISSPEALIGSLLIGVFIYWGWESSVNINEETKHSATAPGLAAVCATIILLITYVSVTTAVVAFAGPTTVEGFADNDAILSEVATSVLGSPWDKFVVLAVLTSALAATQTTIIPSSRTTLSMSRAQAMPAAMGRVHPRFLTPHISTIITGVAGIAWYVPLKFASESFLFDTLSALSLLVTFYYFLAGFACAIYYRRELLKSMSNFILIGVAPVVGATLLAYVFWMSMVNLSDPRESYTGATLFGLGLPLVIGLGFLLLGLILMVLWRMGGHEGFFGRAGFEAVDPGVAAEMVAVQATVGAPLEGELSGGARPST